jgi:NAD(P)-dependent dehydrogenase (short-subunit alcohol dehydrogenase family)
LACRDRRRAEEALKEICRLSGNNNVEIEMLDLTSLTSVRECAKRLRDRLSKLDVLINNAGESRLDIQDKNPRGIRAIRPFFFSYNHFTEFSA